MIALSPEGDKAVAAQRLDPVQPADPDRPFTFPHHTLWILATTHLETLELWLRSALSASSPTDLT